VLDPIPLTVLKRKHRHHHHFTTICIICKQTFPDSPVGPAPASACQHAQKPTIDHRPAQSPSVPAETPSVPALQPPPLLSNLQALLEQYI